MFNWYILKNCTHALEYRKYLDILAILQYMSILCNLQTWIDISIFSNNHYFFVVNVQSPFSSTFSCILNVVEGLYQASKGRKVLFISILFQVFSLPTIHNVFSVYLHSVHSAREIVMIRVGKGNCWTLQNCNLLRRVVNSGELQSA